MMRRILVDHARRRKTAKRSGGWARVTIDEATPSTTRRTSTSSTWTRRSPSSRRSIRERAEVAELRFFGGLSLEETARALDISRATVEREWQAARAWLYRRMITRRMAMTPERWRQITEIFHAALALRCRAARRLSR